MLPRSTNTRTDRESVKGRIGGRTHEISRLVGRSLRAVIDTKALGENTIVLDCDVLQADGGTRTAAITGAYVALADAVADARAKGLRRRRRRAADRLGRRGQRRRSSSGRPVLDLDYPEDSTAETDMNVVMTGDGRFVEVQGTAEARAVRPRACSATLLDLATTGCAELTALQQEALAAPARERSRDAAGSSSRPATSTRCTSCGRSSPTLVDELGLEVVGADDVDGRARRRRDRGDLRGQRPAQGRRARRGHRAAGGRRRLRARVDVLGGSPGVFSRALVGATAGRSRRADATAPTSSCCWSRSPTCPTSTGRRPSSAPPSLALPDGRVEGVGGPGHRHASCGNRAGTNGFGYDPVFVPGRRHPDPRRVHRRREERDLAPGQRVPRARAGPARPAGAGRPERRPTAGVPDGASHGRPRLGSRASGGTGRRARFRSWCLRVCGFESRLAHWCPPGVRRRPADMTTNGRGRLCVSIDDTTRRPDVGDRLSPGDTAPDFTLPDDTGAPVTLGDLRGGKVIVYFYPAAMTPGCTTQACDFSDSLESLKADGYTVLGISPDAPAKLAKFRDKEGLTVTLLSDADRAVMNAVGRLRREEALRQDRRGRHPQHRRRRRGRHRSRTPSTTSRPPATSPSSAATSDSSEDTMSATQPAADGATAAATPPHRAAPGPDLDPGPRGRDRGPSRPPGQDHRRAHRAGAARSRSSTARPRPRRPASPTSRRPPRATCASSGSPPWSPWSPSSAAGSSTAACTAADRTPPARGRSEGRARREAPPPGGASRSVSGGAPSGTRTPNPLIKSQLLCQLS